MRTPIDVPRLSQVPPRTGLVEPRPGWEPRPHPFTDVHLLPDGWTLEVRAMHGNDNHVAGLEADETHPDVVVLTLLLALNEPRQGGRTLHTLEGYPFRARVRLSRPLGSRLVVDGSLPTAEQARRSEISSAIRSRREHQLAYDEAEVSELVDALAAGNPGVVRHWTGFPLTVEENDRVMRVQREMEALFAAGHAWVNEGHADVFAGSIHGWTPEVAIFQVTDEAAAGDLRAALAATGWARFEVRVVRYSEVQLRPLIRRAMDLLRDAGFDVRAGDLDTAGNRVVVHVWDDRDLPGAISRATALLTTELPADAFEVGS